MFLKYVQKGQIGILVTLFENVFEISRRLVRMNDEDQMERRLDCGHSSHSP
jgi:hypothetical protein